MKTELFNGTMEDSDETDLSFKSDASDSNFDSNSDSDFNFNLMLFILCSSRFRIDF